jgi:beta-glucosidase
LPAAGRVAASAPHAATSAAGADTDAATAHPGLWPQAHWPWRRDTAMEARIAALIKRMTLEEK